LIFAGYAFWESYGISGFRGLTTGGVMPMLASAVLLVSGLVILADTLRRPTTSESSLTGVMAYLFPLRVVLFALLVAVYVAVIPILGFLLASGGLLFVAIWALWGREAFLGRSASWWSRPLWALAISALSIGLIYLLFRVVFQVVLPIGSLWR
jgi:hypothetical protein